MKFKRLNILSIVLISNFSIAQTDLIFKASFDFVSQLNDTGIIWAGNYPNGNNTNCTSNIDSPQDCNTGRDVTHNDPTDGHAGFSFTKLDMNGAPLVDQSVDYATTQWSCVKDNVTGLVWEVKTTTIGIHNKGNLYQWGGISAIGRDHPNREGLYHDPSWNELVQTSNNEILCGFDNWRVPTLADLSSIVNKGIFNPSIDTNYFPNTVSAWYWSSSPHASYESYAWGYYFGKGTSNSNKRENNQSVRLVRFGL